MLAITGIAHVNGIELAVHTVGIVRTIGYTAGNAAVHFMLHRYPPAFIIPAPRKIMRKRLTKDALSLIIIKKEIRR